MLSAPRLCAVASIVFVAAALGGCFGTAEDPAPTACDFNGRRLAIGETVAHPDGCNSCTCWFDYVLECSTRLCEGDGPPVILDAGPADRPQPRCRDDDGDSFFTCVDVAYPERPAAIDCDDTRFFVQPGGYEFPTNGVDDD